ncbi:helix-turn-helix domain-containing protein [Macrococcoides caseolyticum]|uniref:helix-turn-helix domain-containing protein n=1 Tax=Macrococcoides caseolyticum TaxID=69966 RepID=UPI000C3387CB|nr:helix-turn-helix transcriptional regulator [Macrococcus caseolyticus]MDJ1110488.1 helix-turn-helix transcriptional regulator [Macrococcus caseolyticus]PKD97553.1 XRE family transcriptional regulator [Macrococcus caseolyticus]PKE52003.1 XRE family transcriptional regulator [Macrococcus caseolyticus]PKF18195.1 XRE family transcriptional regulator [Macrococcus caseolyticus]PKF37524.1 XRE family transcriptional regulator [Macrococcus caseolyticus]
MNTNKNVILLKIGNNITQLRKSKGWSQEELAFECQLHRTYIGSVERGERNIAILNLFKIANALEVEVKEIIKQDSN